AEGLSRGGEVFRCVGARVRSEQEFQGALALLEPLAAEPAAEPVCRFELACTLERLAILLQNDGRRAPEAEEKLKRAIGHLTDLTQADPQEPRYLYRLARARASLAAVLLRADRLPEAEETARQAVAAFRQLLQGGPTNPGDREGVATRPANLPPPPCRAGRGST